MEAVRVSKVVEKDGEVVLKLKGLPVKKGQQVEITVLTTPTGYEGVRGIPADELLHSELVGMWKDREDIPDSVEYARQLREQAQNRRKHYGGIPGLKIAQPYAR